VSDERELLRDTVAALVAKHASPAAVRDAMESEPGYDESLWRLLCEQVGAAALVVPEEFGGAGGTLGDAAVVLEELGKGLVPSPLLGTTLAELALLAADQPDADALGSLAEGGAIGAFILPVDAPGLEMRHARTIDGGSASGALPHEGFGRGPILRTSVPPFTMSECSNHGLLSGLPLIVAD